MKNYFFKNKFDKVTFFATSVIIILYFFVSFLFRDYDIKRIKTFSQPIALELYSDEDLTQPVTLPFNNRRSLEPFELYARLPAVKDNYVIELHGKYRTLIAYLNGTAFFTSQLPSLLGRVTYAGRNVCFIPLSSTYSGKVIKLTLSLQLNPYGAAISDVSISTLASYVSKELSGCLATYILATLLFICAFFTMNTFIFSFLYQGRKAIRKFNISLETFMVSLAIVIWIFTNYDVLGVIVGNLALVGIINYLAFTSMPVFFTSFLCSLNDNPKKSLARLHVIAEANLALQFLLFILGACDFTQLLFLTHLIDFAAVVLTITVAFDSAGVKKLTREQKVLCFGSAGFAIFAVLSMILFIVGADMNYMLLITVGFFLLFGVHMITSILEFSVSLKEHARLLESERNSYKDQLTSLGNRRLYYRKIAKLEGLGIDENMNFIMIDVNGLKVINDSYGHDAGDELLKGTAVCMTESFPDAELLCRMGGDEFFIILKETPLVLEKRMQRFLKYAENWNGKFIKSISMSYGIANHRKFPGYKLSELEKAADEEMYKYKTEYYKNKHELEEVLQGRR